MKMSKVESISLDGKWRLKHPKKNIDIEMEVPGSIYGALLKENIIDNPFYGEKEHEMDWIYKSDWELSHKFSVPKNRAEALLKKEKILLQFLGIDTFSEIFLNGHSIGATEDMYLSYEFNIKDSLREGENILKVCIKSPTEEAERKIRKYGTKLRTYKALPGVPYLRKAQYSFGWDWGPWLPDMGIWKSVNIVVYDKIRLDSVQVDQEFQYSRDPLQIKNPENIPNISVEKVNIEFKIKLQAEKIEISSLDLDLKYALIMRDGDEIVAEEEIDVNDLNSVMKISIDNPNLWWTHDLGEPHLYSVQINLKNNSTVWDKEQFNLGIRDIQLIQRPDKWGESFYFLLNGIPIFAKGANWVPIDSFIPRGKRIGLYEMNIGYAKEANMNMLRVWGGGIYEDERFYDLCDKHGILVWQDFPFACALYPPHQEFFDLVKKEAIYNIKRLRNHPSLALWCGNNEIEMLYIAYLGLYLILWLPKIIRFRKAYKQMFEQMLPNLVKKYDPARDYWPSSPSNGGTHKKSGLINGSNNPDMGDSHFWKVWHRNAPFTAYRDFDSRFMSEYGFESFPSIKTIKEFCPEDQFDFFSPIMENHQKNAAGNKKIMDYMKRRFDIPENFRDQIILSQITQAEAIEYGVEHWRRNRNEFHCMGSLYWQLNDCWPVASWSSFDYYGRWKALHYIAKRVYTPFFASVKESDQEVEFWITNDDRNNKEGYLEWKIMNSKGKIFISDEKKVTIKPCSSEKINTIDVRKYNRSQEGKRENIIFYTLYESKSKNEIISRGFRLFDHPKYFPLEDPYLYFEIRDKNEKNLTLAIKSKRVALYVFIYSESMDFIASDNYFSMEPEETRLINLRLMKNEKKSDIKTELKVHSLYDLF